MVDNIVLSTLTGPSLQKGTSPVISTKDGERDGTRGGGTTGELYDINTMTYLGAFRLGPNTGASGVDYSGAVMAFRPPEGDNGTYGSIFVDGFHLGDRCNIGEWQIPETLANPATFGPADSLPQADAIQPFIRISDTTAGNDGIKSINGRFIGSMLYESGRLFAYHLSPYSGFTGYGLANKTDKSLSVFSDAKNLSSGGYAFGDYDAPMDFAGLYNSPIPAINQSDFGGTHIFGSGGDRASYTPRVSFGPSIYVGDPGSYTTGTLNLVEKLEYQHTTALSRSITKPEKAIGGSYAWDEYRQTQAIHYLDEMGLDTTNQVYLAGNTADPVWQGYKDWYDSDPRIDWSTLTPPTEPINDIWGYVLSFVACGFIVPGTKTFLAIGHDAGSRYGAGYKMPRFQTSWAPTAGPGPLDLYDVENTFYWAYNIDDILAASNLYDPTPYAYGPLPNQSVGWQVSGGYTDQVAKTRSGFFDPDTNRFYLSRSDVLNGSFGAVPVIEVYQV